MSEDSRVPRRSNHQVRDEADKAKRAYGVERRHPVNIIACLESEWIPTTRGRKKLVYNVVDDDLMGDKDGRTEFVSDTVIITVKKSVHQRAVFGDGRSRMTLAHELAHGVMHYGVVSYRGTGAAGTTDLAKINASESAEHQAKVFAAAFLIHDEVAAKLGSPAEISEEFLVSVEAAEICFDRLSREAEHAESARRVQKMNEQVKIALLPKEQRSVLPTISYAGERCTSCGEQKLIPIGNKYLCDNCGRASDQFQDGDHLA